MLKATILYGNMHKGSTWHCADLLKQALSAAGEAEYTEFYLPRDLQQFCNGCFSCFYNGEQTCPHSAQVQPIVAAMEASDVVVLASPVYALDVTGQMKTFLDHLCYMWVSHRPNPLMFHKVGVSIVTTAGAGLSHTAKTLNNSFDFWGFKRRFTLKNGVAASKWAEVSEKKQQKLKQQTERLAAKITRAVRREKQLRPRLFTQFFFNLMKGAMKNNNDWNPTDRKHWEANGWLDGRSPFKRA